MKGAKYIKRRKMIAFVILLVICMVWLLPLLWGIGTSFKTNAEIQNNPIGIIPKEWTLDHYRSLLGKPDMPVLRWMWNSLLIAVMHTGLYLVFASLAAYAFGVLEFKARDKIFWLLLCTTMIPTVINLVPLISMMIAFDWFSKWISLIVPGLGGVFGMFLMRQFFLGIPKELVECAKLEGLGGMGVFFKICLPLSKSALIVAGLFAFMGSWNDYLWPQVMLMAETDPNKWTLPVGLAKLSGTYNYDYGLSMAAAVLSIVPVVVVYMCTQKYIIEGVSRTGIK